jgi:hypothetical protein
VLPNLLPAEADGSVSLGRLFRRCSDFAYLVRYQKGNPLSKLILSFLTGAALGLMPASAQVHPGTQGANRGASGAYSLRNLALGELRFTNDQLYNLYDQGGSPMGLLETHPERLGVALGFLSNDRATGGDSLKLGNHDFYLPQIGFFQPGVFGAILYFQRESESYQRVGGDSVKLAASRFGLDLAAGPASGIFRFGFSAHARMGGIEYSQNAERVLVEIPSLRFDLGSKVMPGLELGAFAGFGGRFDSLESPTQDLERVAVVTFPRFGVVADVGGLEAVPLKANLALEFGTERFFGEYKPVGEAGVIYPTIWNSYWSLETQAMYPIPAGDFVIEPALTFAHRSDNAQGYLGIKGNQSPFKKGDKIAGMKGTRSITSYGLGSHFSFREMVSLWLEWETAGHAYDTDSLRKESYNRFSVGLEHQVEKLPVMKFPEGMNLALRAGWSFRQEPKDAPGYRDFHFDPFISDASVPTRGASLDGGPNAPAAYTAFHFGLALGLLHDQLGLEGMIGFPGQLERFTPTRTSEASGMEFGLTARYRILK